MHTSAEVKYSKPPKSVVPVWVGCLALIGFLTTLSYGVTQLWHPYAIIWVSSLGIIVPSLMYEAMNNRLSMRPKQENTADHTYRVNSKRVGLITLFSAWAGITWLVPYYHQIGTNIWEMFIYPARVLENIGWSEEWIMGAGFAFIILVDRYIAYTDQCLEAPRDGLFMLGAWVLRRKTEIDKALLRQYILQSLVKIFFLPWMLTWMHGNIINMKEQSWEEVFNFYQNPDFILNDYLIHNWQGWRHILNTIDLGFAVVGYACTFKLFGTHTRSAEPTLHGWVICLICYAPFQQVTHSAFLNYDDSIDFQLLWANHPEICALWTCAVLILFSIYVFATVQFGVRFSNLTHRGILTNGVYGWTRHPAYIAKNTMWWLIAVPFISHAGWPEAVRNCILLGLTNVVYYYRAKTEEAHLRQDETYIHYEAWIKEHGLIARLKRLIGCAKTKCAK